MDKLHPSPSPVFPAHGQSQLELMHQQRASFQPVQSVPPAYF